MKPARSAPASAAASTSSWRVRPQTLTSGREINSRSLAAGSSARISAEPTSTALARPARPRQPERATRFPLSATITRTLRDAGHELELPAAVDREVGQIAAVDSDRIGAESQAGSSSAASCASISASRRARAVGRSAVLARRRDPQDQQESVGAAPASSRIWASSEKKPCYSAARLSPLEQRVGRRPSRQSASSTTRDRRCARQAETLARRRVSVRAKVTAEERAALTRDRPAGQPARASEAPHQVVASTVSFEKAISCSSRSVGLARGGPLDGDLEPFGQILGQPGLRRSRPPRSGQTALRRAAVRALEDFRG